jgi:hypothetical protein
LGVPESPQSFTPRLLARILWDFTYLCWAKLTPTCTGRIGLRITVENFDSIRFTDNTHAATQRSSRQVEHVTIPLSEAPERPRTRADEADLNGPRGLQPSPTSASSGRAQSRPQRLAPFAGKRSAGHPRCDLRCGLLCSLRYVRNLPCRSPVYVLFAPATQPHQRLMRSSRRLINQRKRACHC